MMDLIQKRLETRQEPLRLRYLKRAQAEHTVPQNVKVPDDPREAMLLGMELATERSYRDGLVDGVSMTLEVLSEVALLVEGPAGTA